MTTTKVKILLVGAVNDNINVLCKKLSTLHTSKAGPFDLCFCVGPMSIRVSDEDDNNDYHNSNSIGKIKNFVSSLSLPMPVYLNELTPTLDHDSEDVKNGIVSLGHNLFLLKGNDDSNNSLKLFDIEIGGGQKDPLVVGSCPRHTRYKEDNTSNEDHQQQCDILLSSDWPQGIEDVLQVDTEPLSYDVAHSALKCRPRYHVCPSSQYYHASPPFSLPNSDHVGRFVALAPVTAEKTSKTTKFIHALGLEPIKSNPPPTASPTILPCPYLISPIDNITSRSAVPNFARSQNHHSSDGAYSRFASTSQNRKRSRFDNNSNNNNNNNEDGSSAADNDSGKHQEQQNWLEPPADPNLSTLFLYGLHRDVTGELQSTSSSKVLLAFKKYNISKVRHPPNTQTTAYCFLEFPSQKEALECMLDLRGRITIDGVDLTVKWATPQKQKQQQQNIRNNQGNQPPSNDPNPKRHKRESNFVTQDEAKDSMTLYFHLPDDLSKKFDETQDKSVLESFGECLRGFMEKTLEDALNDDDVDASERITAETEPALKVEVRTGTNKFGFLDFGSHAAATMALAAVTKSTDGGAVIVGELPGSSSFSGAVLRWAKKTEQSVKKKNKGEREVILEALGLKRQFFPADSRTDCWFCLASPTCETHLITGVYDEWYAAMPKGPVHPGHVLLVPVTHTSNGAWSLSDEWVRLVEKLEKHASDSYDSDLFVFERCMITRGGYHTHVQCVPVPRTCTDGKLQSTMIAHAKACGFDLRPIQSDLGVKALLSKDDSYFYAEVRKNTNCQRFLYRRSPEIAKAPGVPIQFAREVLAAVLNNPKLAHWKACVVDQEQETEIASDFRNSFNASMASRNCSM